MKYTAALVTLTAGVVNAMPKTPPLMGADNDKVPPTCAFVYGDPHIYSWDGEAVDCRMGEGDYLYAKSTVTPFEIQIRHVEPPPEESQKNFEEKGWYIGSGTQAVVINTGVEGEPVVEVNAETEGATSGGQCAMSYYFDGEKVDLAADDSVGAVTFERRETWEKNLWGDNWYTHHQRNLYFENSGVFVQVTKKYWKMYGCFMNVRICIPDDMKGDLDLYGMLGDADGDASNDFKDKEGNVLNKKPEWGERDDWCNANWCVPMRNPASSKNPMSAVTARGTAPIPSTRLY